jgi:putative ABC transport system permease protein
MFSVNVGLHGYSREQGLNFFRQLPARLESLPGVESAALAFPLPLDAYNESSYFFPEGYVPRSADDQPQLGHISVGPGYFQTMGSPLIAGRGVEERDTGDSQRIAIINETAARRHWGSADQAVGKRFRLGSNEGPWIQVVGVARDGKYFSIGEDPQPFAYFPLTQEYGARATAIVRHRGNEAEVMTSFRRAVAGLDAGLPIYGIRTVDQFLTRSYGGLRMGTLLAGLFATAGLVLAVVGLFGVLHHSVTRRQREIGIRMALGAQHHDVVRLVVVRALLFAGAGLAVGLAGAWAMRHLLGALLVGVSPVDPLTYAAIVVVLAVAALLACYIPARLASRIDPIVVLRCD